MNITSCSDGGLVSGAWITTLAIVQWFAEHLAEACVNMNGGAQFGNIAKVSHFLYSCLHERIVIEVIVGSFCCSGSIAFFVLQCSLVPVVFVSD